MCSWDFLIYYFFFLFDLHGIKNNHQYVEGRAKKDIYTGYYSLDLWHYHSGEKLRASTSCAQSEVRGAQVWLVFTELRHVALAVNPLRSEL